MTTRTITVEALAAALVAQTRTYDDTYEEAAAIFAALPAEPAGAARHNGHDVGYHDPACAACAEPAGAGLRELIRDLAETVHQTGSLRDHADPNDKTGWNVHGIETCEDSLCVDALAALAATPNEGLGRPVITNAELEAMTVEERTAYIHDRAVIAEANLPAGLTDLADALEATYEAGLRDCPRCGLAATTPVGEGEG